jgi:hypothetical protein
MGHVSLHVANVMRIDFDPLSFILHFINQSLIAGRLLCSLCEAMAGTLSVVTTAILSAWVAVVDSGEVGRFCSVWQVK